MSRDSNSGINFADERVKTRIQGFDELFEGGIPQGNNILVSGGPGTGKTIFCLQTLFKAVSSGRHCLYITFEEPPENLVKHMEKFGWGIDKVVRKENLWKVKTAAGSLIINELSPFRIARSVEGLLAKEEGKLHIEMDNLPELIPSFFDPYLIAMDSISALESAFTGKPESYRIYIEQLFRLFQDEGSTNFLITETEEAPSKFSKTGVEEFLADGVFVFYYLKKKGSRIRAVEILKLRGANHRSEIVPFSITGSGLEVYPEDHIYGMEE